MIQGIKIILRPIRVRNLIERKIELKGELTEDQIRRLINIADKCPVHKTLSSRVKILTEVL